MSNKKHKEYIDGKPQLGDRSESHPGCSVYMEAAWFNNKSSDGKSRSQPRPRFLTKYDNIWNSWIRGMRKDGLTQQDVTEAKHKQSHKLTEIITNEFKQTCPKLVRRYDDPACCAYYEYCMATEAKMSNFYLSQLQSLPVYKSKDMFANQNLGLDKSIKHEPENAGWVYLICSPCDTYVKIGNASDEKNLLSRVAESRRQRKSAYLHCAGFFSNYIAVETSLKRENNEYRCPGPQRELFELPDDKLQNALDYIYENAHWCVKNKDDLILS